MFHQISGPSRSPKDWDPQASESPSFSRSRRLGQLSHRLELCLGLKEAVGAAVRGPKNAGSFLMIIMTLLLGLVQGEI